MHRKYKNHERFMVDASHGSTFHDPSCPVVLDNPEHYEEMPYELIKGITTRHGEPFRAHGCVNNPDYRRREMSSDTKWDVIRKTGVRLGKNERISVTPEGEIVVERLVVERDVTAECTAELRKSKQCDGYYVAIKHEGKCIVALGLDDISKFIIRSNGYTLEKTPEGHVSFRVKSTRT